MAKSCRLITSSLPYGYVTLISVFPFERAPHDGSCLGRTYRISVPLPDDRPVPEMEGVLSSVINTDSFAGTTGYLLARHTFQPDPHRARKAAGHLLGCYRQLHLLLSGRPVVGDEQPLVGDQWRQRELAAQIRWAMGWEAVGLDRGDDQVRIPDGCMLFCNGLGRGVAPRIQRVLKSRSTTIPTATTPFFLIQRPRSCGRAFLFHLGWLAESGSK